MNLTLTEAKQATQATELEIAAYVPAENAGSVDQLARSSTLFECNGGFSWPGHTSVELHGEVDMASVLKKIEEHWKAKAGWAVENYTTHAGIPTLNITGPGGTQFIVGPESSTQFLIDSRSACFELPGGKKPGETY